jgi:hypothetical protein
MTASARGQKDGIGTGKSISGKSFLQVKVPFKQCCGSGSESGSTGSTCFWASRIRIRNLLSSYKNSKKNLDFSFFVTLFEFLSLKNDVNVASKSH